MTSNLNYAGISNEPNFEGDNDINLQNTKYYKKKPALYDGESNWEDYLVQFELIAAINKWSDIEKALELATSLRGTARSVLTDLRPEMRTNFIQLTAALASRFQPENQAEMYRAQMKSKIRGRTEQIPVLGQDIKRLVRLAYPSAPIEIKEQLACDCFIDSLNDVDMGWAIFQAKAKSINNAIQVALEYEAFQNDRRKHGTKLVCARKLLELATSLRGGTRPKYFNRFKTRDADQFYTTDNRLSVSFSTENQAEMYRAQMKSKICRRTEQIPVLGQDIKRLVRLAYPSAPIEIKEQLACECFIDSLNDADMEWAIFQAKAKSINNAIQVALEYEAFQNDRRKHCTKLVCAVNENDNFDLKREIYLSEQVDDFSGRLAKIENNRKK
ncbi:unnamed protein product [Mytilus coruscus]|uniref:Uncharacterized protein n=1 Tax=Mytilus coruscus TaxID=42192 RepID=A0A6J8ANP2_MYTCO|nr:unnamed protein product [Mytilus coruscus]